MGIQIPDLHVSSASKATGSADIAIIPHRADPTHTGHFAVKVNVAFDPATQDYPTGDVLIRMDLTDSLKGTATSTLLEQVNSFGKHTPTIFITGRCRIEPAETVHPPLGCHFWLMIANNKKLDEQATPDVVSFVVFDNTGTRVAYGTGPVLRGDLEVAATGA